MSALLLQGVKGVWGVISNPNAETVREKYLTFLRRALAITPFSPSTPSAAPFLLCSSAHARRLWEKQRNQTPNRHAARPQCLHLARFLTTGD